jgi:hypothetical protein
LDFVSGAYFLQVFKSKAAEKLKAAQKLSEKQGSGGLPAFTTVLPFVCDFATASNTNRCAILGHF